MKCCPAERAHQQCQEDNSQRVLKKNNREMEIPSELFLKDKSVKPLKLPLRINSSELTANGKIRKALPDCSRIAPNKSNPQAGVITNSPENPN